MYLMVLEVVLLGIVVFIVAPILLVSPAVVRLSSSTTLSNLTTVILEHISHLCWSAPTTNLFHDQTRNRKTFKITG